MSLGPFQRFKDHCVLIAAGDMEQEAPRDFLIDEGSKRAGCRGSPRMQLDHMVVVVNAPQEGCRVSHPCIMDVP